MMPALVTSRRSSDMRIALALVTAAWAAMTPLAAADAKSQFFTASDGVRIHYFGLGTSGAPVILIHGYTANSEGKWLTSGIMQTLTHGSVHLNPAYTATLVKFIDAHNR
jgi:hypothetical protein